MFKEGDIVKYPSHILINMDTSEIKPSNEIFIGIIIGFTKKKHYKISIIYPQTVEEIEISSNDYLDKYGIKLSRNDYLMEIL